MQAAYRTRMMFVAMLILLTPVGTQATPEVRVPIQLPPPMRAHMLANMRDHLAPLHEIQAAMARGDSQGKS